MVRDPGAGLCHRRAGRGANTQFYTVAIEEGAATSPNIIGGTQDNGCWYAMDDQALSTWKYVHQDDGAYVALPEGQPFQLSSSQQGRLYKKTIDANGVITGYERIDRLDLTQ